MFDQFPSISHGEIPLGIPKDRVRVRWSSSLPGSLASLGSCASKCSTKLQNRCSRKAARDGPRYGHKKMEDNNLGKWYSIWSWGYHGVAYFQTNPLNMNKQAQMSKDDYPSKPWGLQTIMLFPHTPHAVGWFSIYQLVAALHRWWHKCHMGNPRNPDWEGLVSFLDNLASPDGK